MAIAASATTPISATTPNVALQPTCWPRKVPAGTPMTLARVRPRNIIDTALALRFGPARVAATTAPAPKNAPWGSPARNRNNMPVSGFGEKANRALLMVNTPIMDRSIVLRDSRTATAVSSGAPTTTPRAYAVMKLPAVGMEMPRSRAISGSTPIMTNSVVPMPKAPIASASSAMGTRLPSGDVEN